MALFYFRCQENAPGEAAKAPGHLPAPEALIDGDHALVRCDQARWPPCRMENQPCSTELLPQRPPWRASARCQGQVFWEELRKSCICEVLRIAESVQCLVSLLFNEGKDACYFGVFLSRVLGGYNLNRKRWV